MNEAEFDKFAEEYQASLSLGIAASGEEPEYFSEYKIIDISSELRRDCKTSPQIMKILDFGAGIGNSVPYVHKHLAGSELTCLDLSRRSLKLAETRFPKLADYVSFDGSTIPFAANYFDVAYAMCVFHHIDHTDHRALLLELHRVIRPGGSLFIFEHNPYNPLTVRVVNNCPFDANARLIRASELKRRLLDAGFVSTKNRYRIFFPRFLRWLRPLEGVLAWLPLGGQYYARSVK